MKKAYVVCGTTGEYSDRTEWLVDAWLSEDEAKARVTELETAMLQLGVNSTTLERYSDDWEKAVAQMRRHDAAFQSDYTGTRYYYCECELKP